MLQKMGIILCLIFLFGWNGTAHCSSVPPPIRIVSLAPAMTEILFSLGLGERVVGVTTVCDRPDDARRKTKIGGMSNPSLEAIVTLKPDMVVMNTDGNPKAVADRLATLGIKTHVFTARRLAEIPAGIREMGEALGVRSAADLLAEKIETSIRNAGSLQSGKSSFAVGVGKKVVFIIWPSPLIVAGPGTILDDAMKMNGLNNIASDARVPYPRFSLESVIERQPDLILIGKGHNDTMKKLSKGLLKSLRSLEAVRRGRVCYMDDGLYRPGPRIPAGMEELGRCRKMP
jgi:iron complex transport system substrate-binding protein